MGCRLIRLRWLNAISRFGVARRQQDHFMARVGSLNRGSRMETKWRQREHGGTAPDRRRITVPTGGTSEVHVDQQLASVGNKPLSWSAILRFRNLLIGHGLLNVGGKA
jgi:hypothetical protein